MLLKTEILVVEDEADIRSLLTGTLQDEGYQVRACGDVVTGMRYFRERCPSLVILDVWLGTNERDGLMLLEQMKKEQPFLPVIMISGHATIEKAVQSIKMGAYDFLEKPFPMDRLLMIVERAFEQVRLRQNAECPVAHNFGKIIAAGDSNVSQSLRMQIQKVVDTNRPILLHGPVGGGHFHVANIIHEKSERRLNRMYSVVVSSMDSMYLDQNIFGLEVVHGQRKIGLLEQAHLSTLFVDEIHLLPSSMQRKFAEVIQTGQFKRVGGDDPIQTNVRLVFSTTQVTYHIDSDLLKQLHHIEVPALANRAEDLEDMVNLLLGYHCMMLGCKEKSVNDEVLRVLKGYTWPVNFVQLSIFVQWMIIMAMDESEIQLKHMPKEVFAPEQMSDTFWHLPLRRARESFEKQFLIYHLKKNDFNINSVSKMLDMDRTTLYRKLKMLQIDLDECAK